MTSSVSYLGSGARYIDAPNLSISVLETTFAYRDLGPRTGVPLILLNHRGAVGFEKSAKSFIVMNNGNRHAVRETMAQINGLMHEARIHHR